MNNNSKYKIVEMDNETEGREVAGFSNKNKAINYAKAQKTRVCVCEGEGFSKNIIYQNY